MNVILLQVFVSLMLVAGSVLLFAVSIRYRDHEHADRLALFPLEDDGAPSAPKDSEPSPHDSTR
ncbi:cytochrome oxidase [Hyalangium versicolor]|uniref:cytochrome oxidase n=1 Tax=Hyalangium versicolor TaxID=2861190 RepID=UPI001CCFC1A4|nr:cytochrome oxidase [Hyalangium versicolor]